jgi:DNA-binding transcriptional LysR family regulator
MIDLTRLQLFRELAHRGTMTAVAAAARMTSSAVSQQLATLEREAGVPLLERVGRRVRVTAEGARLVAHAETILAAVETAEQDIRRTRPSGTLEVASFSTFARARLLPAIARARKRFPELGVVLHELEPADSIEALRDGRIELAVSFAYNLAPRAEVAGLVSRPLLDEPIRLVLPRSWRAAADPIDLRKLAGADWIVGSRQTDDRQLAERACAVAGFAPRVAHTIDSYELLLAMVAAGLGVGFVPELALESAKGVVVRTPRGAPLRRRVEALTRTALAASPLVGALVAELT